MNFGNTRSLLLNPPLLLTGETDNIKIWDLRASDPVIQIPEQIIPFSYDNKSGIFKMLLNGPYQLLVGSNGLMGLVEIDLRNFNPAYYPVHDYQILTLCHGKGLLNNLVVTSGSTKTFSYEISVHLVQNLEKSIKFTPGHKGVINAIEVGDDCIASSGKDGSLRVLKFDKNKERLKTQSKFININS